MRFIYPPARRSDVVDVYHGVEVPDPYRWTEDPDDPETRAFVAAQNAVTEPYLASLPEVAVLRDRMAELWDVPRTGVPQRRGDVTVWTHNDGLQPQPVFLVARGDAAPEVLLDPNDLSDDGAVAVMVWSLSPDGRLMAYTVSESGSDQQVARVLDTATGEHLADELHELRFTGLAWWGDGLFYSRFPGLEPGTVGLFTDMSVYYHRIGTPQAEDELIFANPDDPTLGYDAVVSDDDRFLVLHEYDGTSRETGLLFLSLEDRGAGFTRLASPGVASHVFLAHHEGRLILETNRDAPNGRIVAVPLDDLTRYDDVVPETADPIEMALAPAGRLVVVRLHEAAHEIALYDVTGAESGEIALPEPATVTAMSGTWDDPTVFVGFESFVQPPAALAWEAGETRRFAGAEPPIDPDEVVIERRHAVSSDGAEVGMFVLRRTDATLPAPTELYGYGGFTINVTPQFSPARLAWLGAGGVVVSTNLRGGTEHGEAWHRQGMLGSKQQVFDDFVACAESLIAAGVTTPSRLGIRGRSNGGLLTAAVMLQRPELFGAVISHVPVTDMYRYQHFTAGRYWTVEFGDVDDGPEVFRWLSAYSPIHNVDASAEYPPLLVLTAETDDRVVPMHSHKFIAELQHAAAGSSEMPLLELVETRAGHGLGKPTGKLIEESARVYGFLLHHLR